MSRRPEAVPRRAGESAAPPPDRRQAGYAVLSALFVLLLVSLALSLVASSLHLGMRTVRHQARDLHLTALTDAALAEALAGLADNGNFAGFEEHPYGDGTLESEVTPLGSRRWRVTARVSWGGARRAARVEVVETVDGLRIGGWRPVR